MKRQETSKKLRPIGQQLSVTITVKFSVLFETAGVWLLMVHFRSFQKCLATLGLNNPAVATLVTNVDGRMLSKNDRTVRASAAFEM